MTDLVPNEYVFIIIIGYIDAIIGGLGLIGNLISLPVLYRRDGIKMTNTTLCLFVLTIFSILFLILSIMITSLHWIAYGEDQNSLILFEFTIPARAVGDQLTWVFITGHIFTTIVLGIDRSVAIVKPAYWARAFTAKRIKIALFLVFIFSGVINIPTYLSEEYFSMFHPGFNRTFLFSRHTEYSQSYFHDQIFLGGFVNVYLIFGVMFVIFVCCGTFVAHAVVRCCRHRKSASTKPVASSDAYPKKTQDIETTADSAPTPNSEGKSKDNSSNNKQPQLGLGVDGVTAAVFTIMVMSIINRNMLGLYIWYSDDEESLLPRFCSTVCVWFGALRHFFLVVNMSWNFLIFLVCDKKFRAGLIKVYCPCNLTSSILEHKYGTHNKAFHVDIPIMLEVAEDGKEEVVKEDDETQAEVTEKKEEQLQQPTETSGKSQDIANVV